MRSWKVSIFILRGAGRRRPGKSSRGGTGLRSGIQGAAVAGGLHLHRGLGAGGLEVRARLGRLGDAAGAFEALGEALQRPHVAGVLAQVLAVDAFGLLDMAGP